MAMTYQNFASLGVNLNRQKYGPLDISNVFTSAADLKYYLTKGTFTEGVSEYWYKNANEKIVPYPYEGQVLATVIDGVVEVYVLALDADGNFETREIGAKVEADGKTIKVNADGKLELVGIPADITGKTLVPSLVNGELTWAEPDTSTAEGQAQEINALKLRAEALEATVNGTEEADGLVDKVEANAQAIVDEAAAREAADSALEGKIAEALQAAKDYADENDADTAYDDTEVVERIDAIEEVLGDEAEGLVKDVADNAQAIADMDDAYKAADAQVLADAKAYADEELAGIEVAIEQKENVEHIVIKNKAGNEIAAVNASKFVQDSFLDDVSYSAETGKVTFVWTMGDGSSKTDEIDISALVDTYTAGTGLKLENNEFAVDTEVIATAEALEAVREIADAAQTAQEVEDAIDAKFEAADLDQYAVKADVEAEFENYFTKTEVEEKGYAVATEVEATYATKQALSEQAANVASELAAYAKASDVEAELAKKIETATIAHSDAEKAEGVTVDGTKLNIVVDAYTKAETRDYVAGVIEDMTGGESAADVLLALNNHIAAYTEKVGQIDAKDLAQDTAIAAAQAQADKGVTDAASAAAAVAELANGQVATNVNDIAAIKGRLTTLETANGDHETRLATAEGEITALKTSTANNSSAIGTLQGNVSALTSEDARLAGLIGALDTNKANVADVYTKADADEAIKAAIEAIPAVDLDPYAKVEDVEAYVAGLTADISEKADASDVYTKDEANLAFMTQDEVDDRINALIDAANDADTITNINNLVAFVNENASDIAALITDVADNSEAIAQNAEDIVAINEAIVEINSVIDNIVQPKASDEISVADDGELGITKVSTDKLVQGSETLVLSGGSATV